MMSLPRKVFFVVFGLGLLFGAVLGLINLVAPDAVSIELNGAQVEGMTGLWTSIFSGGLPGFFFGLLAAGITALVTRKKKKSD